MKGMKNIKIEFIEAPPTLTCVIGYEGESLPARLVAVPRTWISDSGWYCVEGWVTQVGDHAVFRCPRWPTGGRVSPSEAVGYRLSIAVPYAGMERPWRGFQYGITADRNVAHIVCVDTSERV